MLTEAEVARFHERGFVKGSRVLSDQEVDELRDELTRVIENHDTLERKPVRLSNLSGDDESPVWQIVNIWNASDGFHNVIKNRKIVEELAQLTGANELRIFHDQIQYKPAQVGGVNMWHQDAPLWPILEPMTEVSAWVALDDVDEDNGCMSMVPGSHRWGNQIEFLNTLKDFDSLPDTFEGNKVEVVPCPVRKGEVHYHHALTWHGSPSNRSGRPRRAVALHYMTQDTRFVAKGEHPMKPFVEVGDGEVVRGENFPLVLS
jgi:phytanoyl-CoA hydroxylase